jgi:diguanylate cyclase (GGDEF)-like protein
MSVSIVCHAPQMNTPHRTQHAKAAGASWRRMLLRMLLGLKFTDPAQERRFQQARDQWLRPRLLSIILLIAVLFLVFLPADRTFAPEHTLELALVRVTAAALLVGVALATRLSYVDTSTTLLNVLVAVIVYAGVFAIRIIVGGDVDYHFNEAMMLIQIGVWFFGGLGFSAAAAVTTSALVAWLLLESLVVQAPVHGIWLSCIYLGLLGAVCAYASLNLERLFRANFADSEVLAAQREDFRRRAMRDGLTGLWNRAAMEEHLAAMQQRSAQSGLSYAVLMIDLDNFKPINDRYGHAAGDDVLVSVARRIQSALRPGDSVGRLGGDEFLVLAEDLEDEESAAELAERIRKRIESPIRVRLLGDSATVSVNVGASIGVRCTTGSAMSVDTLLAESDQKMYRRKAERKAGR